MSEDSEEHLVILQFTDIDDANYSQQFSDKFKTIDIESKNPIIQIGSRFYRGEYSNNIGTYLFFNQEKKSCEKSATDSGDQNSESATPEVKSEYAGKSFKKLILNRLFIEEKQ